MSEIPCSDPPCDGDEICADHDEEQAHEEGQHEYCGVTCEVGFPTEQLYNSVALTGFSVEGPGRAEALVRGIRHGAPVDEVLVAEIIAHGRPGTKGMVKELIRRVKTYDPPICPWIPSDGIPSCDFDPECPVHGIHECPDHGTDCEADEHVEPPTVDGEVI